MGSAVLPVRRSVPAGRNVAGTSEGILFGRYARLVGAPNCAPSLRSLAGLLLALALQSGLRGPPPPSLPVQRRTSHHRRASISTSDAYGGIARESAPSVAGIIVCSRVTRSRAQRGVHGRRAKPTVAHFTDLEREARGVLGGAPAARARPFGRACAPQRRACEDTAPKRTSHADPGAMN